MRNVYGFTTINLPAFEGSSDAYEFEFSDLDKETQASINYYLKLVQKKKDPDYPSVELEPLKLPLIHIADTGAPIDLYAIGVVYSNDDGINNITMGVNIGIYSYLLTLTLNDNVYYVTMRREIMVIEE